MREARQWDIRLCEDTLVFTPQMILCAVACILYAKTLIILVPNVRNMRTATGELSESMLPFVE